MSLLSNVGLTELIASSVDEYVKLTVDLIRDRERLTELRSTLRMRLLRSPLMDEAGFTREFERLVFTAWNRRRGGEAVASP